MPRKLMCMGIAAAALAMAGAAPTSAAAAPADNACFWSSQWRGWSAPDPDTLYLRVGQSQIYRVELTPGAHVRDNTGEFLINELRGSNSICSHLDLDLALADTLGFKRPLIARSLTRLSPAEIAAIPRKDLP